MSEVDTSIYQPLIREGAQPFDVGKMMSLASFAQDMKLKQASVQKQNALAQMLSNPQSYGPDGNVNQNALPGIMAADPQVGLKLKEQSIEDKLRQAQEKHYESETGTKQFDFMSGIAGVGYDAYTEAKKTGASEEAATAAGKKATNEAATASGGMLSDQQVKGILAHPFDPTQVKAFASMNKDWIAGQRAQEVAKLGAQKEALGEKKEDLAERRETANEKQAGVRDALMLKALGDKEKNVNPKTQAFENFMKEHPNATPQEQAQFIQTTGAAPRSPTAMAMAKFAQEHPDATSEDYEKFNADMGATKKASADFSTGKQGQAINSFNVATTHLQMLDELGKALNNKDVTAFNKIANTLSKETGNPAPTNFDAAKKIVSDEVVKAIVAGGGGVGDREQAQAVFDKANSPEQLQGAIKTVYGLMGGQLKGLQQQYEQTTKKKDFMDRLSPEAKKALLGDERGKKSDHPDDIQAILDRYK